MQTQKIEAPQPQKKLPLALIFITTLLLAIPFHLKPQNFIVDDGYFYPQIARYIAHGQGSTFNGILFTNGYHPLWMLVCVIAASLTSASAPLIQILTAFQDVLTFAAVALLVRISEASGKRAAILGCIPILFFATVLGIWRLLEANLALFLQIATLLVAVPLLPGLHAKLARQRSPLLGVLLGVTLLARLDLLFFAVTVLAYELLHAQAAPFVDRLKRVLLQGVILSAILAPYLFWNVHTFGHLLPISGAIKSTFPHMRPFHVDSFAYPVVLAILLNGALLFRKTRDAFDTLCILTAAASLLHLAYTLCYGGLSPWYLTTGYLGVSLCIIWIANALLRRFALPRWTEYALGGLTCALFLLLASLRLTSNFSYTRLVSGQVSFHNTYVEPKRALAEHLRNTLPAGTRIFIFDAPGGVAYDSGMSIIPADGLVSDYRYNQDIQRIGFAQYAAANHIDYFIAPYLQPAQTYDRLFLKGQRSGADQVMQVETPLGNHPAGQVTLSDSQLLFRSPQVTPELAPTLPELGVWRIQH